MITAEKQPVSLPTPEQRPQADVVIFDGHCNFCRAQVERIHRYDGGGRLAFLSLHDPVVRERYPDLTHEQLMQEMAIVDTKGTRHLGAKSLRYLTRRLPRLWIFAPLLHIPFSLPFWKWGYKQVAKRRYKIAGKTDECEDGACKIHWD